jgi:hypothetical protein
MHNEATFREVPTIFERVARLETQNENDRVTLDKLSTKLDKIVLGIASQSLLLLAAIVLHSLGLIK